MFLIISVSLSALCLPSFSYPSEILYVNEGTEENYKPGNPYVEKSNPLDDLDASPYSEEEEYGPPEWMMTPADKIDRIGKAY